MKLLIPLRRAGLLMVLLSTLLLWGQGLLQSPLWPPWQDQTDRCGPADPGCRQEKILAEAYWQRYPDIREHRRWGEDSPLGIHGPREHFINFGKRELRVFAPLPAVTDLPREQVLAEAYWSRYPQIGSHPLWGKEGYLGVLGARDHYVHFGRFNGMHWGE